MVPGENPQHSKSPDEPVTIDLTAERIKDDTTSEVTSGAESGNDVSSDQQAPGDAISDTQNTPAEPSDDSSMTEPEATKAAEETAPPVSNSPAAPKKAGSSSGNIAAGIFGGLIALLGAGSIQYAGFIPSLGPAPKAAPAAPDYSADIETLKSQLAALTAKPAANTPDLSPIENRIAALENSVSDIAAKSAAPNTNSPANDAALKEMAGRLNQLENDLASAKTGLAEAEKKLEAPKAEINVGKAIAMSGLKAAIDRGGPFVSELETLSNVAADDPAIAKLQPFAKAGVLSRAQLIKQMPEVADTVLNVMNQPAPGTGLTERLVQSALSAIKIRPVGEVEGEGPAAIIARMEERLQNGDLKGSAEQWNTLPDAAKQASKEFKASLDTRITVEGLIGEAMSSAVAGSAVKG